MRYKQHNYKRNIALTIVLLVLLAAAYGIDLLSFAYESTLLVAESEAFSFENRDAEKRILVVGDSTAVGTGAEDPILSVAGRFHSDFPEAEIVNLAENGAKAADVLMQIRQSEGRFDLALVHSGANDILYFTVQKELFQTTRLLLQEARLRADTVVFMVSGDLGLLPAFDPPISWIYSNRSAEILPVMKEIAEEVGVIYVDFYSITQNNLPVPDFERYTSRDFIHFNGDGYGVWYDIVRKTMQDVGVDEL